MNTLIAILILTSAVIIASPAIAAVQTEPNPVTQPNSTLLQYLLYLNPTIGLQVTHLSPNCLAFDSGSTVRSCNRVLHSSTPTPSDIAAAKEFFNNRPFTWVINASDSASQKILQDNGLHYKIACTAMQAKLDILPGYQPHDDISVTALELNQTTLNEWATLATASFPLDKTELLKALSTLKQHITPPFLRLYIGFYQGKSVSTVMAIQHTDTLSLHLLGTLPEYRKKGLASAVLQTALTDGKKSGCTQAVLLSITTTSLFKKIGFGPYATYKIYGN